MGVGVKKSRTAVLISGGKMVEDLRTRHGSCRLAHHHKMRRKITLAEWVRLGMDFGGPPMEDILSCGVPRTLITVWD